MGGAGYGGRSSWEDKAAAGLLSEASRNIGDIRSQAGVATAKLRMTEEGERQNRALQAAQLAAELGISEQEARMRLLSEEMKMTRYAASRYPMQQETGRLGRGPIGARGGGGQWQGARPEGELAPGAPRRRIGARGGGGQYTGLGLPQYPARRQAVRQPTGPYIMGGGVEITPARREPAPRSARIRPTITY